MGFLMTVSDTYVYCIRARNTNGKNYRELLLVYVYDVLCCSQNPQLIMDVLVLTYDMNDGSLGPPNIYLWDQIKKYQARSGKYRWSMSITQCANTSINTVEEIFKDEDRKLVGILHWAVELGRIDIFMVVAVMSQYSSLQ